VLCRYRHNVHSTGSQKRLAREGICEAAAFGSAVYSKEELCAEMGAAYLCAEAGISTAVIENQAAYVAGWLNKLRDDRKLLIHAAAQAQHAADYIWQKRHSLNFLRRSRTRERRLSVLLPFLGPIVIQ
jgi:antirestriction protein ArdC